MKKWFKIFLVLIFFAAISIGLFFIFKACGIANIESLKKIISKTGKWGFVAYTIILILMLSLFCFIPLLNPAMSILGIAIFGAKIAFITNIIAVFFSTTILFFIGDKLGEKFASKLVGAKSLKEAQNLIDHKSKFWLPILFIAPCIPDEAICLVAGMTKIKYWYLLIVSMAYHIVEIAIFCFFGSGLICWESLSFVDWFLILNVVLIDIYLLIKLEKYLDKKLKNNKN